ncbi:flavodoxin [Helicobacter valdiviensis]|uniref:Flavodoxin n=1 Tax=Helicobacter valdiviensis TaxID=1458358 RepID=A0A2W6MXK2_9HELI|nr:flavodoxin [Helicobacter valdiviensis]PZT49107.1 flavodoxin [Helicobacter valdiviensis]
MEKIGLFYGSDAGTTKDIAQKIAQHFENIEIIDVVNAKKEQILNFKNLILATPSYGSGDLQSDWESFLEDLEEQDFQDKIVALVGVGDQDTYGDTFCNGLYEIYKIVSKNAKIIGQTSTDGYEFEESLCVIDGKFIGLMLDQDNQEELSDERISKWCETLKGQFN